MSEAGSEASMKTQIKKIKNIFSEMADFCCKDRQTATTPGIRNIRYIYGRDGIIRANWLISTK